jgi:radical SAM superfamily enzyme YgiQ (UPF0313 family)
MPGIVFIDAPTSPRERIGKLSKIIDLSRDRPHIGILTLAAVARERGWRTQVIDPYPFQWSDEEIRRQVLEFRPDVIGISSHTLGIVNGNRLAGVLKDVLPQVPILVGGPHVTSLPDQTLMEFPNYDIGVMGEAEEILLDLLELLPQQPSEEQLKGVEGISFRGKSGIVVNPRRQYRLDLDSIPMPAWDLLPQFPFLYSPTLGSGAGTRPTGSLFTTRGCPWRCKFCDRGVFGDNLRKFSARKVMDQILHLYHEYDIRELMFGDDTLLVDKQRMMELSEMLIDAKLDLRWECMARVIDADLELYHAIKKAGCFEVSYGIESADDRISKLIFKPINQKTINRAIQITKEAGIRARGYFIFGLPGETEETLAVTSKFILTSGLDDVAIFSCTPYPGSALYQIASSYGTFEKAWNRMNNVETVFVPYGLTAERIESLRLKVMRKFYFNPRFVWAWSRRLVRENGWKELLGRGGLYARFFKNTLAEFVSGLGRAA